MGLFKRDVPIEIVFDDERFQEVANKVANLVSDLDLATAAVHEARMELDKATRDFNRAADRAERIQLKIKSR
jgi:hypothetical protein